MGSRIVLRRWLSDEASNTTCWPISTIRKCQGRRPGRVKDMKVQRTSHCTLPSKSNKSIPISQDLRYKICNFQNSNNRYNYLADPSNSDWACMWAVNVETNTICAAVALKYKGENYTRMESFQNLELNIKSLISHGHDWIRCWLSKTTKNWTHLRISIDLY